MAVSAAKILACLVDSRAAEDDDSEEREEDEEEDDEPIPMDSKFNPKKGVHKTYWNTGNFFPHTHTHTHTHTGLLHIGKSAWGVPGQSKPQKNVH